METGLGKRIKQRRLELGLTQNELSARMGYKSKAAICKVECGEDNITSDRIERFADALECSVAHLMGWDDVESFDSPEAFEAHWNAIGGGKHPITLTDTEYTMVVNYRAADPGIQESVLKLLDVKDQKNVSLDA